MKQVNTTYWKVFRIDELFDVVKGKRLTKADMVEGKTNYIGATAFNNGITAKIGNSEYIHPAGTITVCYNGSIGQTFYQEKPFWATDDVNVLYPKFSISKYIALFICPIIYKVSLNYAYVDKWTAEKMRSSKIKLPSTPDGSPDWKYMEEYMRKIEQRTQTAISAFLASKNKPHKIDTTYWKEFIVSKYFITEKDGKQVPTGANIPKLELKENGKTPRITVTAINNGVFGYFDYIGDKPCNYRVFRNFVSVSFLGTVFYQKEEASLDMKVHCIKPLNHQLNTYTGIFLVSAIRASLKNYKYSDQLSSTVLPKLKILLPATPAGEPDWRYMEMYMRGVEAVTKEKISLLTKKKQEQVQGSTINNYGTVNIFEK